MTTIVAVLCGLLAATPLVEHQQLRLALLPESHAVSITSRLTVRGAGRLDLRLTGSARIARVLVDGAPAPFDVAAGEAGASTVTVELARPRSDLVIEYAAALVADVIDGERPGEIHNTSVHAHVGTDGVFLADDSAWHPRPLGDDGYPALHAVSVEIEPIEGWAFVASGEPAASARDLGEPVWNWRTPRPVDGVAVAGGRHRLHGRLHAGPGGPVEVVMHVPPDHEALASMFIDAACAYLDLYTPLLGPFPYRRFSIVENFFSSGFAYPGFTLLGPRVVAMAPRSLAPGYLDHELIHNWWGNGVYVDPGDGNWCEALTSFCANYYRRIAEDGEAAGLAYRRGILMRLSTDPETLDDGPLGEFGRPGGPGRFVGYDKGTFVFIMLGGLSLSAHDPARAADDGLWRSLRRFAAIHMGKRASWQDIQEAFETTIAPQRVPGWLDGTFELWVRDHTVPMTVPGDPATVRGDFAAQYRKGMHAVTETLGGGRPGFEIDPGFMLYRVLPPGQIIPTFAGTTGAGGLVIASGPGRPELAGLLAQLDVDASGENLLIIGAEAARAHAGLLAQATDPIRIEAGSVTVGGVTYDRLSQAVLHTMQYPGRPGRFITVFHANGDAGWSRLRLVPFYTRDTTIVWDAEAVVERRVFEPDRRIAEPPANGPQP